MGVPETLTRRADDEDRTSAGSACGRCGEPAPSIHPLACQALHSGEARRCLRCGIRWIGEGAGTRYVFTCQTCGLPFSHPALLHDGTRRCDPCLERLLPPELPDEDLVAAADAEVRGAVGSRWTFGRAEGLDDYLDGLAGRVARSIEGAPTHIRVALCDDPRLRSLALPSGLVLLDRGLLAFLEDEGELVYVLAHEVAHAASGDAAERLTRLGFLATARDGERGPDPAAWLEAAEDVIRLGYGRDRELEADARALETVFDLGYDPQCPIRFLRRLESAIRQGNERTAEIHLAHPPPGDRIRRIERGLHERPESEGVPRVNREVLRRVRGSIVDGGALAPAALPDPREADTARHAAATEGRLRRGLWLAVGAALLTALFLAAGMFLGS